MAHRSAKPTITCLWLLLSGLWPGVAADFQTPGLDEDLPDMNELLLKAEAGQPQAQTRLADSLFAASDFTNAVGWYRRAAAQDHIPAQLSLAACLVAGRGAAKDPAQAARLLRASADLLEKQASQKTQTQPLTVPGVANPAVATNAAMATNALAPSQTASATKPSTNSAASASPRPSRLDGAARVERVQTLVVAEPELQTGGSGKPKPPDPR